jgi:hypothetical protein
MAESQFEQDTYSRPNITGSDDRVRLTHNLWLKDANHTLRILLLLNGGAPIAVFAFMNALLKDGHIDSPGLTAMTASLGWFACGVASAALAVGFSYFANYCIVRNSSVQQASQRSQKWFAAAIFFQVATAAVAFTSLGLFLAGLSKVRSSIAGLI